VGHDLPKLEHLPCPSHVIREVFKAPHHLIEISYQYPCRMLEGLNSTTQFPHFMSIMYEWFTIHKGAPPGCMMLTIPYQHIDVMQAISSPLLSPLALSSPRTSSSPPSPGLAILFLPECRT
jgi:hypothetical protein